MKSFNELQSQDLRWVQTSWTSGRFELKTDQGEVVATMRRPSWWRSLVEIDAVGNRWQFERKGFWQQRVEVRSVGTGEIQAVFRYRLRNSELQFNDGRVFYWRVGNFWASKWMWVTASGEPIVGFQTGGAFKMKGEINLDDEASQDKTMPMLVFLGWYLIVLYHEDAGATV